MLSQEEVDELKKQAGLLTQRVESTRSNLAIQSKYRDAAASMARLYTPGKGDEGDDERAREAERERAECGRKCDELASELLNLEKRLLVPHRKILEHTAAILQLTHKASKRRAAAQQGQMVNGIPGSPESLYTYSHSRNSLDQVGDDAYFDDAGAFPLDGLDARARKNAIEIPLKSPIREQNQLRVELDRMREENAHLRSQTDGMLKRMQSLNVTLRDTIVRFNPDVNRGYAEPPRLAATPDIKLADLLKSQVEYLESGLVAVQAEQDTFAGGSQMGERLEAMNLQLRDLLMVSDPYFEPTALPSESDVNGQLQYLEDSVRAVDTQMSRSNVASGKDESGIVLTGLWDSMQRGLADARQRKDEHRRMRAEKGLPDEDDDDDKDEDEGLDSEEPYSLDSFATRVKTLHRQATTLKDHKYVLKRQIKQQRELNNQSDAEKDGEMQRKQEELDQSRQLLDRAEKDAMDAQKMLSDTLQDLEEARAGGSKGDVAALEQQLEAASKRLDTLGKDKETAEATAQKLKQAIKTKEGEAEQLEAVVAELKTEVTIARAELDGAYGSRAERAAEVAAIKQSAESTKLQTQVDKLKKELGETVQELEGVTKETIGSEREKTELEGKLDEALSAKVAVEAEMAKARDKMAKLQEELDGERLKIRSDGAKPGAGASMLSEKFRATMREERKKFQEDLKVRHLSHLPLRPCHPTNNHTGGARSLPQARRGTVPPKTSTRTRQEPAKSAVTLAGLVCLILLGYIFCILSRDRPSAVFFPWVSSEDRSIEWAHFAWSPVLSGNKINRAASVSARLMGIGTAMDTYILFFLFFGHARMYGMGK